MSFFTEWLFLGLVSFGGPGAHLGLFEGKFVGRMSSRKFSEYLAMSATLPGATSSQLATCIGVYTRGVCGGLTSFFGFALPGFVLMTIAGIVALNWDSLFTSANFNMDTFAIVRRWIDCASLSIVSVAAVALTRKSCQSQWEWYLLAFLAAGISIQPNLRTFVYPLICILCGFTAEIVSRIFGSKSRRRSHLLAPLLLDEPATGTVSKRVSLLSFFTIFCIGIAASQTSGLFLDMFSAGMFVFGGGPVAIPYLHTALVSSGLVTSQHFLSLLSLMYIAPGPMFNMSMFLGMVASDSVWGGLACWVCMMVPGVLLVFCVWPWWKEVRDFLNSHMPSFIDGLNSGACGLLIGAGVQIWLSADMSVMAVLVVCAGIVVEIAGRLPPYSILLAALALGLVDLALFKLTGADILAQRA